MKNSQLIFLKSLMCLAPWLLCMFNPTINVCSFFKTCGWLFLMILPSDNATPQKNDLPWNNKIIGTKGGRKETRKRHILFVANILVVHGGGSPDDKYPRQWERRYPWKCPCWTSGQETTCLPRLRPERPHCNRCSARAFLPSSGSSGAPDPNHCAAILRPSSFPPAVKGSRRCTLHCG